MSEALRKCGTCKKSVALNEFAKFSRSRTGLSSTCKQCARDRANAWRLNNLGRVRERRLASSYGITTEQYNSMLAAQNNVCAICKLPESVRGNGGAIRPLDVDHCHTTGKIRGLLCTRCNKAIGILKDDISIIESAIVYLQGSQ
jgi:hypothetical protein